MPTDNSRHLHAAQRLHHARLVEQIEAALRRMEKAATPVTFPAVPDAAGVSRAFIYKTPSLRSAVERLRGANHATTGVAVPAGQRRSEASKDATIARLRHDNNALREKNKALADQNAALLGRLRATHSGRPEP